MGDTGEGDTMQSKQQKKRRLRIGAWNVRTLLQAGKFLQAGKYQMIDDIMINGLYGNTKRKAENRVEWRMLSLQWKICPWAEHYDDDDGDDDDDDDDDCALNVRK